MLAEPGYLKVADVNLARKNGVEETFEEGADQAAKAGDDARNQENSGEAEAQSPKVDRTVLLQMLADLKKNDILTLVDLNIKEGETSPPKRYTSGSIILAMENAGQLIEDEELRAQIKGCLLYTSTMSCFRRKRIRRKCRKA